MGVRFVSRRQRAPRRAARRPCRLPAARAAGGRRADPCRQAACAGTDRGEAAARLRERADPAGGRLQDTERAAGARHHRSARHAGGRGRVLPRFAGEDVAFPDLAEIPDVEPARRRLSGCEGDDGVPRRLRRPAAQGPDPERPEAGASRSASPSPNGRRRTVGRRGSAVRPAECRPAGPAARCGSAATSPGRSAPSRIAGTPARR